MAEFECGMCGWTKCHTCTNLTYHTAKNGNLVIIFSCETPIEVNIKPSDCQFVKVGEYIVPMDFLSFKGRAGPLDDCQKRDHIFPKYHLSYKERTEPLDYCPRCERIYFAGQLISLPKLSIGDQLCAGLTRVGIDQFYAKTETFAISEGPLYVEFQLPKTYKYKLEKYQTHQGQEKYNLRLKESYGPIYWFPTDAVRGYIYTNFIDRVEWYLHFDSMTERYKEPIKMIITYVRTSGKHTKPALRMSLDD